MPQQSCLTAQMAVNIRAARKSAGLSQERLARTIDVSLVSVQNWESGRRLPRTQSLVALAAALAVDVPWLFSDHAAEPALVA